MYIPLASQISNELVSIILAILVKENSSLWLSKKSKDLWQTAFQYLSNSIFQSGLGVCWVVLCFSDDIITPHIGRLQPVFYKC
jgi:hypothetical protein